MDLGFFRQSAGPLTGLTVLERKGPGGMGLLGLKTLEKYAKKRRPLETER